MILGVIVAGVAVGVVAMGAGGFLIRNRRTLAAAATRRITPGASPALFETLMTLLGGFWVIFGLAAVIVGFGGG